MTTASIETRKLGKLAPRVDVRTIALSRYVDRAALPKAPPAFDETGPETGWPMYANDRIGDCTCAASGHMIEAWSGAASDRPIEIPEAAVLDAFDHVKIVDPQTGEEGAIVLDVLKYWRKTGMGGHRVGAFARVSLTDRALQRTAAWLFGGLYLGIQLPVTAQRQETWDWTGSLTGPAAPGSWGGHAVDVVGYDDAGVTTVTWGALKRMTWSFFDRYVDEAYALLSHDFLSGERAPNGFDLPALRADLELVTA